MAPVLAYVDPTLIRQMATGLIGSEVQLSESHGSSVGLNFKVLVSRDRGVEKSTTTRLSDLLPEALAEAVRDAIPNRISDLESARTRLVAGAQGSYSAGTPLVVSSGNLTDNSKVASAHLGGERCTRYTLRVNEFSLHTFFDQSAEELVDSFVGQPIEVAGILRYSPPYSVPGVLSLSLGMRICALWLR